jgi:hypothetical protein
MIIAIVPSPDHAHLTAEGPLGERPALLYRFRLLEGAPWGFTSGDAPPAADYDVALVLHAPGDPRLGMLRAMEVAFPGTDLDGARVSAWADGSSALIDGMGGTLTDWDAPAMPVGVSEQTPAGQSFALAHLLLSLGKAVEVVTLETAT